MKKLNQNLFSILIIFFLSLSSSVNSEIKFLNAFKYQIIVTDGDTIKMLGEKIRLFGIDAPEMKQICKNKNNENYACGHLSKNYLKNLIKKINRKTQIYCYYSERDRYNRIIGECYIGEESRISINRTMVSYGHAVAYTRYSEKYLDAQKSAMSFKFGLWSGTFDLPEEWRRKNK
jgi:endonuclease YncB( thermonuclease family)